MLCGRKVTVSQRERNDSLPLPRDQDLYLIGVHLKFCLIFIFRYSYHPLRALTLLAERQQEHPVCKTILLQ